MTNPCCTECGTYKMMSNGNKDYSTIICTDPACECHKSADNNYFETLKEPALKFDAPTDLLDHLKTIE